MSSETSIEPAADVRLKPGVASDALQPWQLFTLAGLIGATVVVFVSRGQTPAGIILLSLTIFTAAAVGIAAWRTLGPLTVEEDVALPRVSSSRTRAVLERDKALILRSIKELEFDRAMGKVSEKDFAEMSGRLRARAARIIRQLDAGATYRQQIEVEVARRLSQASVERPSVSPGRPTLAGSAGKPDRARATDAVVHVCAACGTDNDIDSRFCKHCGASLEATE